MENGIKRIRLILLILMEILYLESIVRKDENL
jgi:hypothetical protein